MKLDDIINIPGYVMGLEAYPERFQASLKELQKVGFTNITWVKGIDGRIAPEEIRTELAERSIPVTNFTRLAYAGLGLTLLHTLEDFLKTKEEFVWIFEDDVIMHDNFHSEFLKLEKLQLSDFDILYLGGIPLHGDYVSLANKIKENYIQGIYWHFLEYSLWFTHAMLMNRRAAEIFIDLVEHLGATDGYITAVIPRILFNEKREPLRQVCVTIPAESAENHDKFVLKIGEHKAYGLLHQRKDIVGNVNRTDLIARKTLT